MPAAARSPAWSPTRAALATLPAWALLAVIAWLELGPGGQWRSAPHAAAGAAYPGQALLRWGFEALAFALALAASLAAGALWRERESTGRRLRELAELNTALFDTVGAVLMVLDRHGRIVRFNRTAREFFGCSFEAIRDRPRVWTRFVPADRQDEVQDVFTRLLHGEEVPSHENPWIDRAGQARMFEWHNSTLRDDSGQVLYVITFGVDVTEARRAQELSSISEARYRNLVEHAPDAIVQVDADGRFALVNQACVALLGAVSAQQLLGRGVLEFVAPAWRGRVGERVRSLRERGGAVPALSLRMLRLDGSEVEVESVAAAWRAAGQVYLHVILRDLSERRRLEREVVEAATAEQERIGREIHDGIGQKLSALGMLSASLQRRLEREQHTQAAQAADRLVQELQAASAEARLLARGLSPIRLDHGSLLIALHELAASVGASSGVHCELSVRGSLVGLDEALATHLYRIAQEALNNAAKHARAGHVEMVLQAQPRQVCLSVRDDGSGLAASRQEGLGLSIMRHRAALMGGWLEVESVPGVGTTVRCCCAIDDGSATDGRLISA